MEVYHKCLCEDALAGQYLAGRGLASPELLSGYKVGYAGGNLLKMLAQAGQATQELKAIGVLNDKGGEHFYGCVTFLLYDLSGSPCGSFSAPASMT